MVKSMNMLLNELARGYKLVRELDAKLNLDSIELCASLVQDILDCFENVMAMAKANAPTGSPRLFTLSPQHGVSEQPFKAEHKEMASKKRKMQRKGTSRQVKLGSGPEAEGPLDDGFSWRKYGQKEILRTKHPRGYFRCSHRQSQGCLATKQVQQSDDNPTIFEVTYRGSHTCQRTSSPQTSLKVKSDNLNYKVPAPTHSSSFSFPSTPIIDFTETLSAMTSANSSPMMDVDFLMHSSSELGVTFDAFDASNFLL
ncbi:probable WRKY transcription factor 41 [Asparagus officinalis]|nr:probable WRKY transcription factor 41 [Asparagus officinalis]